MTTNKGAKGIGVRGKRNPDAVRRVGVRLPMVAPEIAQLLDAICTTRGGTRGEHVTKALLKYATLEEAENAGMVE